jgi:calcineurin-like phosphoesterase family protein
MGARSTYTATATEKLKPLPRQFDVGVDVRHFQPVRLVEIIGKNRVRTLDQTSTFGTDSNDESEA